jgi:radical SAM protein with 4Fe4S-binding SPASM domain
MECKLIDKESEYYKQYRYNYINGYKLELKKPVDISLELSSSCNLACNYCYHGDPKNLPFQRRFMDTKLAIKIINNGAVIGVNSIKMNWRGESTLHPDFLLLCAFARSQANHNTYIERITNSNFMFLNTKEEIFKALCHQTKVKVSYDSFIPKVMEKQRARSRHALITANIDKFYNYPGRDNEIVIQAVRTSLNKDEDIEGEVKKRWPSATVSVRDVVEGRKDGDIDEYKVKDRNFKNRQTCLQAHVRLIFAHNGDASPCCPDIKQQLILGNARKESLIEIFAKGKLLRKELNSKKAFAKDPCANCSSFESYKGYKAPCHS